jgi:hypothetical protein
MFPKIKHKAHFHCSAFLSQERRLENYRFWPHIGGNITAGV